MAFTICLLALLGITAVWCWTHRNRYGVIDPNLAGPIKEAIVTLPLRNLRYVKLRREVKIFNRLCLVMPTVRGVAIAYRQHLQALLQNPEHQPTDDPYERLFYGYACEVLLHKTTDEIKQRQLQRNLLFLFAPTCKIVKKINPVWSRQRYELYPLPRYKIFADCYLDPYEPDFRMVAPLQTTVRGSYLQYFNREVIIKRYAHFYELNTITPQTLIITVAPDKQNYDCQICRGVVTCKHLVTGKVHTYTIRGGKVRLTTSVCAKIDALEIYVHWQGFATISLDNGVKHLVTRQEYVANQKVSQIITDANNAKFVTGERLRQRYQAALKVVPSLKLFTRVVMLNTAADFWAVWLELAAYRQAARLFHGFNLVFLYSGANQLIADLVATNITAAQVKTCQDDQLLLYFVDRTITDPDTLYFLTRMTKAKGYPPPAPLPDSTKVAKTWPYVKTITVTNPDAQTMTRQLVIPICWHYPCVVTAKGTLLTVVSLESGHVNHYILPAPVHLKDEMITTHLNITLPVKLAGYESRQFTLQCQASSSKSRLRKKDLMMAIENINVQTTDKKLDALFAKPLIDGENGALLQLVKAAYQNMDRKLLLQVLESQHQLPTNVWQFLLTKLVGLRVLGGKIHLTPCVNIMGEFRISFTCYGQEYHFNTQKCLPTSQKIATIKYGNHNG